MKIRKLSIFLVITIIMTQFAFMQSIQGNAESTNFVSQDVETSIQTNVDVISPSPYGGVENIKSNYLRDQGFEVDIGNGQPSEFSVGGYSTVIIDSEYQTDVHAGTYGCYMKVEGTKQFSVFANNEYYTEYIDERSYMNQLIDVDFWYNCKANPDISANGQVYVYFQIMTDIGNIYLFYYLSSNTFPSANDTYNAYFDLRGSLNSWININRNFTKDFVDAFPARDISVSYIRRFYFTCQSVVDPIGAVELLFDEVRITNGTSFNYLANNGDFEDGDSYPWVTRHQNPGYVYLTENDYSEGSKSLNLTSYSTAIDSVSRAYVNNYHYQGWQTVPKGLFARESGDYEIEFDWKYTDTSPTVWEYAYYSMSVANDTFSADIYFVLGDSTDSMVNFNNYTWSNYAIRYLMAENFSVVNNWNHFSIDYFDTLQSLGFINMAEHRTHFFTEAQGINARAQLLVDELELTIYPLSDPSFENNFEWYSNDPILAWRTQFNDDYANITTDAYNGNYAANITAYGGFPNAYCERSMYLPVENNQFTDFMWRLDDITDSGDGAYAHIILRLDDGMRNIYYVLGRNDGVTYTNSSSNCNYYVDGFNQTGSWTNLFRNVSNDVYTAFGVNDWSITEVEIVCYAGGSDYVSVIVDNLHFVEDNAGPTITNPTINPSIPEPSDSVLVSVDVVDSSQVLEVALHYQIGAASWVAIPMTLIAGEYTATIPTAAYGVAVNYYFTAEDVYAHASQLGSTTSPYTYVVGDDTLPSVSITSPISLATVSDDLLIEVDASDAESGVDYVEFFDGVTSLGTDYSAPYTYLWDTRSTANDTHSINVIAHDNNGNTNSDSIDIYLNNDFDPPILSNIQLNPTKPVRENPVEVSLEVDDYSGIDGVQLFYKIDNGSWTDLDMVYNNPIYVGSLPAIKIGQTMQYYIVATDDYGQSSSLGSVIDPFEFTIKTTFLNVLYWYVIPIGSGALAITVTILILRFVKRRKVA